MGQYASAVSRSHLKSIEKRLSRPRQTFFVLVFRFQAVGISAGGKFGDHLRGEGDAVARIVLSQFLAADPRAVRQLKVVEMDRIVVAVESAPVAHHDVAR